jgi:hypothetical protein
VAFFVEHNDGVVIRIRNLKTICYRSTRDRVAWEKLRRPLDVKEHEAVTMSEPRRCRVEQLRSVKEVSAVSDVDRGPGADKLASGKVSKRHNIAIARIALIVMRCGQVIVIQLDCIVRRQVIFFRKLEQQSPELWMEPRIPGKPRPVTPTSNYTKSLAPTLPGHGPIMIYGQRFARELCDDFSEVSGRMLPDKSCGHL